MQLLFSYKNKKAISISALNQQISNEKFKIPLNTEDPYNNNGEYLLNECKKKDINIHIIKYLIEHGVDIKRTNEIGRLYSFIYCM